MAKEAYHGPLEKVDECCYRIPKSYRQGMRVDGLIFTNEKLLAAAAQRPGPRAGGQRRLSARHSARQPGHAGHPLGLRLLHRRRLRDRSGRGRRHFAGRSRLRHQLWRPSVPHQSLLPRRQAALCAIWSRPCSATSRRASAVRANTPSRARNCTACWRKARGYVIERGLGEQRDVDYTEAHGRLDGADPDLVSDHAKERGAQQCGTLGSGNHFLEVQIVDQIFDEAAAAVMGLEKDMVCVMIHSGSRGLGYQVCDDALAMLRKAPEKYGIDLPDRQLACAPINSPEGPEVHRRHAGRRQFRLVQPPTSDAAGPRSVRRRLRPHLAGIADELDLRCLPQHRQVRGAHRRRQDQTRSGSTARERRGPFRRTIRRFRDVPQDRPAGHHPRRHGPGQLGAGRSAGQHGKDVRHDLPRRRPGHEPHRRPSKTPAAGGSTRNWRPAASSPVPRATRVWRRSSRGLTRMSTTWWTSSTGRGCRARWRG